MRPTTRKALMLASGLLLRAQTVIAATDLNPTSHLGAFQGLGQDTLNLVFWLAVLVAILSLLAIWIYSNVSRQNKDVSEHIRQKKSREGWFVDLFLVLIGFLLLFKYVLPQLTVLVGVN